MGRPKLELAGQVFGRWAVVRFHSSDRKIVKWWCRCECGTERAVRTSKLREGVSQSCGCLARQNQRAAIATHQMTRTPPYYAWRSMWKRCTNPRTSGYRNWGGRGIRVCDEWQTFEAFWRDMGPTWQRGLTLDRIDNEGNYEPQNCRWATWSQQVRNRRPSVRREASSGTHSVNIRGLPS